MEPPSIACWSQNETKTSLVLGDDDAEWEQKEFPTLFDLRRREPQQVDHCDCCIMPPHDIRTQALRLI